MVFGLFSKDRAIKRAMKKAQSKLSNSQDRWPALERLRDEGSDESLYVLFKRFSFMSSKMVEDQQEKEWTVESLIAKGEAVLPALRRYLADCESASYPLRVLDGVASVPQAREVIAEIMAKEKAGYSRDPKKKVDILSWLSEYRKMPDDEMVERVVPYLQDFDENVRFAAVEAISLRPTERAAEPLVAALVNPEEESGRLKRRIADVLADAEMELHGRKSEVAPLLETELTDFRMHHDKLVRKTK
ncbi:MAG TPA: HEAT repeat domain-containing protein [Kofleriaceae bacterium]|nr:HEAT repeat domain-containing protein [Kofleriaceae bacterium]